MAKKMFYLNFAPLILLAVINIGFCEVIHLNCPDITVLVDGHNNRRELIASGKVRGQPAASNMTYIKWDEELAEKAEAWAAKGVLSHNPDRELASKRFITGENLFTMSTTAASPVLNLDEGIDAWFKEHEFYKFGPLSKAHFQKPHDRQIGHYTQMVWSDTIYVGCGLSKSQDKSFTKFLLVCNYGPGGNVLGKEPYKKSSKAASLVGDKTKLYGKNC